MNWMSPKMPSSSYSAWMLFPKMEFFILGSTVTALRSPGWLKCTFNLSANFKVLIEVCCNSLVSFDSGLKQGSFICLQMKFLEFILSVKYFPRCLEFICFEISENNSLIESHTDTIFPQTKTGRQKARKGLTRPQSYLSRSLLTRDDTRASPYKRDDWGRAKVMVSIRSLATQQCPRWS